MISGQDISLSPTKHNEILKLTYIMLMALFLMLAAGKNASGEDLQNNTYNTINTSWTHYHNLGHFRFNTSLTAWDGEDFQGFRRYGVSSYFIDPDIDIRLTGYKSEDWNNSLSLSKGFSNRKYTVNTTYNFYDETYRVGGTAHLLNRLYLTASYNSVGTLYTTQALRITDVVSWYSTVDYKDDNDYRITSGLNITFSTGNRVTRRRKIKEKEVVWW